MRDGKKDRLYFKIYAARKQRMFAKRDDFIKNHSANFTKRLGIAYDNFREHAHHTIAIYSMGESIEDVRSAAIDAIDALDVFTRLGLEEERYFLHGDCGGYSGGVEKWYWVLSFCILFDLPREKSDIVLDHLSLQMRNREQATDALVNKMVKYLGYPGQDETEHLIWPEAYAPLYACFATEANRADQLKSFVDGWYREMGKGDAYWHNNHKNKHDTYFGYWTFEAAAVAKMLHINDAHLRA